MLLAERHFQAKGKGRRNSFEDTSPYYNSKHNFFNNLNYRLNFVARLAPGSSIVVFCHILMASSIEQTFLLQLKASCATHSLARCGSSTSNILPEKLITPVRPFLWLARQSDRPTKPPACFWAATFVQNLNSRFAR